MAEESGQQRFDPLVMKLTLRSERVASGKSVRSRMDVQNPSAESVIDPSCLIDGGRYALVPAHDADADADAEVWIQPVIDCQGPFEIKPGFRDQWWGPSFPARTKSGAPLPRGKYLAVLEIEGLSKRLEYPVTVE